MVLDDRERISALIERVLEKRVEFGGRLRLLKYKSGEGECNEEEKRELLGLKAAMISSLKRQNRLDWIGFKAALADSYASVRDRIMQMNTYVEIVRPYFV